MLISIVILFFDFLSKTYHINSLQYCSSSGLYSCASSSSDSLTSPSISRNSMMDYSRYCKGFSTFGSLFSDITMFATSPLITTTASFSEQQHLKLPLLWKVFFSVIFLCSVILFHVFQIQFMKMKLVIMNNGWDFSITFLFSNTKSYVVCKYLIKLPPVISCTTAYITAEV